MTFADRKTVIEALQNLRNSKVLVHFLSDRRVGQGLRISGMQAALAGETHPLFYEHLRQLGRIPRLDLVLYTSGGHLDSAWPIVQLLRSFTDHLTVIVPMKALSAGTLLCLGADEILMSDPATLSPVDPSTTNPFNPKDAQGRALSISVEDVTAYFDLATDERETKDNLAGEGAGLKSDEHMLEVFKALSTAVGPLALGNVKRVHNQIRALVRRMLALHIAGDDADIRINRIVRMLTEELYSHGHLIGRSEAIEILGDDFVKVATADEADQIWNLHEAYSDFFELSTTFNLREWLGADLDKQLDARGGVIESEHGSHLFGAKVNVSQSSQLPQGVQIQIQPGQRIPLMPGLPTAINLEVISEGWLANADGA